MKRIKETLGNVVTHVLAHKLGYLVLLLVGAETVQLSGLWPREFAEWSPAALNAGHQASGDGFVIVNSYGDHNGTGVRIEVDGTLCARLQDRYATTMCAVRRGSAWRVSAQAGASVKAMWMSVVRADGP